MRKPDILCFSLNCFLILVGWRDKDKNGRNNLNLVWGRNNIFNLIKKSNYFFVLCVWRKIMKYPYHFLLFVWHHFIMIANFVKLYVCWFSHFCLLICVLCCKTLLHFLSHFVVYLCLKLRIQIETIFGLSLIYAQWNIHATRAHIKKD